MDSFGEYLQTALAVLTLTALGGVGYLRGTIANLRGTLSDVRADLSDADRKIVVLDTSLAVANNLIAQQRQDLEAIARMKTGEEHWIELGVLMNTHHQEAVLHWTAQEEAETEMVSGLTNLARVIAEKGIA